MKFNTNIGQLDRILRIGIGALLILLALFGKIGWWGWLGLIPLATGIVRFCPIYPLMRINTCARKNDPEA